MPCYANQASKGFLRITLHGHGGCVVRADLGSTVPLRYHRLEDPSDRWILSQASSLFVLLW